MKMQILLSQQHACNWQVTIKSCILLSLWVKYTCSIYMEYGNMYRVLWILFSNVWLDNTIVSDSVQSVLSMHHLTFQTYFKLSGMLITSRNFLSIPL